MPETIEKLKQVFVVIRENRTSDDETVMVFSTQAGARGFVDGAEHSVFIAYRIYGCEVRLA